MKIALALIVLLTGLYAAETGARTPAFRVTSLPPITVDNIASGVGFVGGTDGVPRTCPNEAGVGVFVRGEGKGATNAFVSIDRNAMVISTPTHGYTIACLKVDLPKAAK